MTPCCDLLYIPAQQPKRKPIPVGSLPEELLPFLGSFLERPSLAAVRLASKQFSSLPKDVITTMRAECRAGTRGYSNVFDCLNLASKNCLLLCLRENCAMFLRKLKDLV